MQEEENGGFMHERTLRKRAGLSHESSYSPPQSAVEAFEMIDRAAPLALGELSARHNRGVDIPDVGTTVDALVSRGNTAPQHTSGRNASTTQSISHDLARASAQS